jgi:hypothetical protein
MTTAAMPTTAAAVPTATAAMPTAACVHASAAVHAAAAMHAASAVAPSPIMHSGRCRHESRSAKSQASGENRHCYPFWQESRHFHPSDLWITIPYWVRSSLSSRSALCGKDLEQLRMINRIGYEQWTRGARRSRPLGVLFAKRCKSWVDLGKLVLQLFDFSRVYCNLQFL